MNNENIFLLHIRTVIVVREGVKKIHVYHANFMRSFTILINIKPLSHDLTQDLCMQCFLSE